MIEDIMKKTQGLRVRTAKGVAHANVVPSACSGLLLSLADLELVACVAFASLRVLVQLFVFLFSFESFGFQSL